MDESYWLLSTAYNTGVECLRCVSFPSITSLIFRLAWYRLSFIYPISANLLDEAKRWFESATVICRFVSDGKHHSEKVLCVPFCSDCSIS